MDGSYSISVDGQDCLHVTMLTCNTLIGPFVLVMDCCCGQLRLKWSERLKLFVFVEVANCWHVSILLVSLLTCQSMMWYVRSNNLNDWEFNSWHNFSHALCGAMSSALSLILNTILSLCTVSLPSREKCFGFYLTFCLHAGDTPTNNSFSGTSARLCTSPSNNRYSKWWLTLFDGK